MDFNKVIFGGNIVRDPELRYTPNGDPLVDFSLAQTDYFGSGDDKKEYTNFVDVTFWGRKAEVIAEYHKKGDPILIEGSLRQDRWEKEGQKRSKVKIRGYSFEFVKQRDDGDSQQSQGQRSQSQSNQSNSQSSPQDKPQGGQGGSDSGFDVSDSEIPF